MSEGGRRPLRDWPLVGRADYLKDFSDVLAHPDGPRSRILAGPAGVGKTRLAAEFAARAEEAGYAVVRVIGTATASRIPLGAFAGILRSSTEREPLKLGPAGDRSALLRSTAAALHTRADGRPVLLVVDDAHLLDEISAALIQGLAANREVTVVATVRSRENAPEPIVGLWKDDVAERLDIAPLTSMDIERLLAQVLDGPVDPAAARSLAKRSGGNVLYLRELVQSALADNSLRIDQGFWRLTGGIAPSARLVELVNVRLTGVDDEERRALELLALGEPLTGAELAALSDLDAVERLERRELVTSTARRGGLEIRLAHPVYADVLRAAIPALRVPNIMRELADAAERVGPSDDSCLLRIAMWRLDAGDADPELLLHAVDAACHRHDFVMAERLATAAVDAGAGFEAELRQAQVIGLQGRLRESENTLLRLRDRARGDEQRARVAVVMLDSEGFFLGRPAEALEIAESTAAGMSDSRWKTELAARRATLVLGLSGPAAGAEAAIPLLATAQGNALSWASIAAAYSLTRLGRFDEAIDAADLGLTTRNRTDEVIEWQPSYHYFHRGEAIALRGDVTSAYQQARELHEQALEEGSVEAQACFALELCKLSATRGRFGVAIRYGQEAVALYRQLGRPQFQVWSLQHLAHAHALAGQGEEAARLLGTLTDLNLPTNESMAVDLVITHAWTALARGNRPGCLALLAQAHRHATRTGDLVGAASAVYASARLDQAAGKLPVMHELAEQIEGDFIRAQTDHVAALAHDDPAAADRASRFFEQIGADYPAAQAAADRLAILRRTGATYGAGPAWEQARALMARIGNPTVTAFTGAQIRVTLTSTEMRVATLAAEGYSNKDIAKQLGASVRTVETHLQRVYRKLGVSSRTMLSTALAQ